jgi:inner membrane protein
MEPVTHILTGAILGRTGFNRRAAYATLAMAVAAEFPDIDTLWSFAGPIPALQHHRGITHTFLGIPFEAALITGAFYLLHRLRKRPTKAPPNWRFLYLATLIALLSHLFLDWTNNYGLRPFFPFDPHWYAGSFVFIFEPILFALLLIGLLAPALFGLINSEIGAHKAAFRGRGWAIAALLGASALWGFRFYEHDRSLQLAATADAAPQATRLFSSPSPGDPFTWHIVADTPGFDQLYTLDTRTEHFAPSNPEDTLYKAAPTVSTLIAKRSPLGEVYLDWSQYPLVDQGTTAPDGLIPVTFRDARFLYSTFLSNGLRKPPLSGAVFIDLAGDRDHRVDHMELDGRIQR